MFNIHNFYITILQVALIILIWFMAGLVHQHLLPFIPQGLIGMFSLFLLLMTKIIPYQWVQKGASLLISTMLLFFIPAVIAILDYKALITDNMFALFSSMFISIILVLTSVAWAVHQIYKIELKIQRQRKK